MSAPDNPMTPGTSNEEPLEAATKDYTLLLREKILFGLDIYPYVSPTMLHTFLGPATSAAVWRALVDEMVEEGILTISRIQLTSPHERVQTYTIIHKTVNAYSNPVYTENNEDPDNLDVA